MRRLLRAAAAAAALACALPALAAPTRPFTVEDLLQAETLGAAAFDPGGHGWSMKCADPTPARRASTTTRPSSTP